jgi:hypothetical protein
MRTSSLCLLAALAWLPGPGHADSIVYISVGESGETAFSDQASANARRVEMEVPYTPSLSSAEQVAAMLAVAEELAAARAIREAERAAKRAATQPPGYLATGSPPRRDERFYRHGYIYPFPPPYAPPMPPNPPERPEPQPLRKHFAPKL